MEARALEIKAALTAIFGTIGLFVGWKGALCLIWLVSMLLDYISGSIAARKNNEWDSSVAREGLYHKGGTILVVLVAAITDAVLCLVALQLPMLNVTWPGLLFPLVLVWYIITEFGSILENSIKMGAPIPHWLARGMVIMQQKIDDAGSDAVDKLEEGSEN